MVGVVDAVLGTHGRQTALQSNAPDRLADELDERGFPHLRVRRRGAVLTIQSGKKPDVVAHARLRRDTVHLWLLEMPTSSGAWEPTPFRDIMDTHVERLTTELAWTLAPR